MLRLYGMELEKLCKKKRVWITALVLAVMTIPIFTVYCNRVKIQADFGMYAGYWAFVQIMSYVMFFLFLWLIVVLSPALSENHQRARKELLGTAKRGRDADYFMRVAAGLTIATAAFVLVAGSTAVICGQVYGYVGAADAVEQMKPYTQRLYLAQESISFYLWHYLLLALGAAWMLTALLLWISAVSGSGVQSLLTALTVFLVPCVLENFTARGTLDPFYLFVTGQPALLIVNRCFEESWQGYGWHVLLLVATVIGGILGGWISFRRITKE